MQGIVNLVIMVNLFFDVKDRSLEEEQQLTEMLFLFLMNMTMREEVEDKNLLYKSCEQFISAWWREGYEKGERRYRLKLY